MDVHANTGTCNLPKELSQEYVSLHTLHAITGRSHAIACAAAGYHGFCCG